MLFYVEINTEHRKSTGAAPHRAVLVADPQLVDPHTYPGRPWPLSSLTVSHTDLYLSRAFSRIQSALAPQTIFFLGDLFDGGREWATEVSTSPEKQYEKYDKNFWPREYERFSELFVSPWMKRIADAGSTQTHKMIASLPGNHDLGFGNGIRLSVRERFNTFFGDGNRVEIIGNHTFVSVDTVSFSAKLQPELEISQKEHSEAKPINFDVWNPTEVFLAGVIARKSRALQRELRVMNGQPENPLMDHSLIELSDKSILDFKEQRSIINDLPSVLLTHVPLYRAPGTPCGPLRERWPPSKTLNAKEPLEDDPPNAIRVEGGYQYQNVLQQSISKDLIHRIGNVEHVFSGDDHDYCEIVHREYTSRGGGVREVTVKSMSWAMGVRKPGFLLVSLWNPLDENGHSIASPASQSDQVDESLRSTTIQTHLCLLPDQLEIFLRYLSLFVLTVIIILAQAIHGKSGSQLRNEKYSILPLTNGSVRSEADRPLRSRDEPQSDSSCADRFDPQRSQNLAVRSNAARTRSASPNEGYAIPMPDTPNEKLISYPNSSRRRVASTKFASPTGSLLMGNDLGSKRVLSQALGSLVAVAVPALMWYAWLLRS